MSTEIPAQPHPARSPDLTDRVALVTGGTRGIGAAIVRALASDGATIAVGYSSSRERADALLDELRSDGSEASVHQGNVGDFDDCERVISEVIDQHGRIDILVNNAGVNVDRPVTDMSVEDWHKVMSVNLNGVFYMTKPVLEHMIERGTGRIINISSVVGERGNVGQANYAASKSGIFGFTKSLAREAAAAAGNRDKAANHDIGVTVNAVTPGLIETDMTAKLPDAAVDALTKQIPMGRIGQPEEVARVVCFLAADASSYITGQIWAVNGGYDM